KLNASIFTVGCETTKRPIAPAANIMTPIAITIAMIMTSTCSAMPTAVITESRENTMSISAICTSTPTKPAAARSAWPLSSAPSRLWWISSVALPIRNSPPPIRIRSRPEMSTSSTLKSTVSSRMIHVITSSSRMRVPIARARPSTRARWRCASGSRPTSTDMKTMLSMPRTISSSVRVASATHASGELIHSIERVSCYATRLLGRLVLELLEALEQLLRRQVAAEQLAVPGVHRRRAAHAHLAAQLVMLGHRRSAAFVVRHLAAELRAGQRRVPVLRAPDLVGLRPRLRIGTGTRIEEIAHLDTERIHLVDVPMELPAVAAIDVREDRDGVLRLAVGAEHDHLGGIDGFEQRDSCGRASRLGHVLEAAEAGGLPLDPVAAVLGDRRDVRADRDLVEALDRRIGDVARADPVQLRGDLFLGRRRGLVPKAGRDGKRERQHDPRRLHGFS